MLKPPAFLFILAPTSTVAAMVYALVATLEPGPFIAVLFGLVMPLLAVSGYCVFYTMHHYLKNVDAEISRIAEREKRLAARQAFIAKPGANYDARP